MDDDKARIRQGFMWARHVQCSNRHADALLCMIVISVSNKPVRLVLFPT